MHTREEKIEAFGRLLDVLDELRVKCPWDRKQTNESLRPNTIEEVYELCDALMKDDKKNICKELGDVLLHVVFYAKIGSETGDFDIKDVCDRLCDKLIFDWEDRVQVWDKVKEEISEFESEVATMDKDKAEAEFGDVMFSLINAARLYKINPDNALEHTNQKFIRRFNYLEEHTLKAGRKLTDMTLEEMDAIWEEAKKQGL